MLRTIAALISLVVVMAACSGSPATSSGPTPVGQTPPPAGQTPPLSLVPDQPLADAFPDEIGGEPLPVQSASGPSVLTFFGTTPESEISAFLATMGKGIDDLSAAYAFNLIANPTNAMDIKGIGILAVRVKGVPATDLLPRVSQLVITDKPGAVVGQTNMSGKTVTTIGLPDADPDDIEYLYAYGDAVFEIGGSAELVAEVLSKLP